MTRKEAAELLGQVSAVRFHVQQSHASPEDIETLARAVRALLLHVIDDMDARPGAHSDPGAVFSRREIADALTAAGYPTAESSLATYASRGGGPPFQRYGNKSLYRWGDALDWAQSKLIRPACHTSAKV